MEITNEDNILLMARYPDKHFNLAIVDPPYGLGKRLSTGAGKMRKMKNRLRYEKGIQWDNEPPTKKYFEELFRVSKNQIIFGGNYFNLPPTRGIICWDKKQMMPTFSRWEYAWTSFDCVARIISIVSMDENRIHTAQKPIRLYKWILENYANAGDKILDTHLGSGSIAIACHDYGFDLTGCELNKVFFDAAMKRIKTHTSQTKMF